MDFAGHPPALRKSNTLVSLYPSCSCIAVKVIGPVQSLDHPTLLVTSTTRSIILPKTLHAIVEFMSQASISPGSGHHFTVANLGATDHMFPEQSAFLSYKSI